MEFAPINDVYVTSSLICLVIDFKMVLTAYCKQQIIQLYFEQRIIYSNVAKVLAAEGFQVPKQTMWATIQKYKTHGTIYRLAPLPKYLSYFRDPLMFFSLLILDADSRYSCLSYLLDPLP